MNIKPTINEVKHLSIKHYLSNAGMQPDRIQQQKAWYRSPIGRNEIEKTPSLVVDLNKNRFTDFGSGVSGDIIDLVCALQRVNVAEAIEVLANGRVSSFKGSRTNNVEQPAIEVLSVKPIEKPALKYYLAQRGIPLSIAQAYCSEIHYKNKDKTYYTIGFPNDKKGWELRNSLFKNCISPKTITTVEGKGVGLNIFEGFFDYLSCLAYYKTDRLLNTTVILNSVTNYRVIEDKIKDYDPINLFLDNDPTGERLANRIVENAPNAINISRTLYPSHKDFNLFLLGNGCNA